MGRRIISSRDSIWVQSMDDPDDYPFYENEREWWNSVPGNFQSPAFTTHPENNLPRQRGWTYHPDAILPTWWHLCRPEGDQVETINPNPFTKGWTHYTHGEGALYGKDYPTLEDALEGADSGPPGRAYKLDPRRDAAIYIADEMLQREHRPGGQRVQKMPWEE